MGLALFLFLIFVMVIVLSIFVAMAVETVRDYFEEKKKAKWYKKLVYIQELLTLSIMDI